MIELPLLEPNKGQLAGLPKNPRLIRDNRYKALKRSIEESPQMLELRELIVFPLDGGHYVIVCGNHRYKACAELGYKTLPCKVLSADTPMEMVLRYAAIDNVSFAQDDIDVIMNEWNVDELEDWGMEIERKGRDEEHGRAQHNGAFQVLIFLR